MANFYETGTFTNNVDLVNKIKTKLTASGWSTISTITASQDFVFYSSGEDGYRNIYARAAANLEDTIKSGRAFYQKKASDGYGWHVNFLMYQHFPSNGGVNDGYGRIGIFGSRFYYAIGSGSADLQWSNILTATASDGKYSDLLQNIPFSLGTQSSTSTAYDGRRYLFARNSSGSSSASLIDLSYTTNITSTISDAADDCQVYVRDVDNNKNYLINLSGNTSSAFLLNQNGSITSTAIALNPNAGFTANAFDRGYATSYGNYIYVARGGTSSVGSTEVSAYNILTNSWTTLPVLGATPSAPVHLAFVEKEPLGLTKHRLYHIVPSQTTFAYLNIEDNGTTADVAWTASAVLPTAAAAGASITWDGYGSVLYLRPSSKTLSVYNIASNSWSTFNASYAPTNTAEKSNAFLMRHLCSKVICKKGELQKYWILGNKDYFQVIVKDATGTYNWAYCGEINSYFDDSISATTTASASSGSNVVISVNQTTQFSLNQKVSIYSKSASNGLRNTSNIDGYITYNYLPSESFTITAINPGVSITADSLTGSYASGSVIATDYMSGIVTNSYTYNVQALNKIETTNSYSAGDPAEQVYLLEPSIDSTSSSFGTPNANDGKYSIWPMLVRSTSVDTYSGKEVRGQLNGVFITGSTGLTSETVIEIGGYSYLVFFVDSYPDSRPLIVGPIN